jgi:hypothetical protein
MIFNFCFNIYYVIILNLKLPYLDFFFNKRALNPVYIKQPMLIRVLITAAESCSKALRIFLLFILFFLYSKTGKEKIKGDFFFFFFSN